MRVKRFVASNIQEAMAKVKLEFGNDAVILHTRRFKEGGFLGFFSKEYIEVTAAVDERIQTQPANAPSVINNIRHETLSSRAIQSNKVQLNKPNVEDEIDVEPMGFKFDAGANPELNLAINEMRQMMEQMKSNLEVVRSPQSLPKLGQIFYNHLENQELDSKISQRIVKKIIQQININPNITVEEAKAMILLELEKGLKKPKPILNSKSSQCQMIALVGPTGVGKTTTIAKLAANFSVLNEKKIAFITIDTYRIAAVEQLKAVGDIIGVPVNVIFTPSSLKEKITELKTSGCDYIFIDTAGRSHKSAMHMAELKAFMEIIDPEDIFLVLSSTTKYRDMTAIIQQYSSLDIKKLIFTKLDETSTYGPIFNIINKNKKILSYITTGQNIPDDIEIANPQKIAKMIVEGL